MCFEQLENDFSFVKVDDACGYDGDSNDSVNDGFDNNDFIFPIQPTNVENAFLHAKFIVETPIIDPIELIKNPYSAQTMPELLDKDNSNIQPT